MSVQSREISRGTYLIGSNLVLPNGLYSVRFVEGSGIVKIFSNVNKRYILICEYMDEEEQGNNKLTLIKGMLISVEGTLKIQLIRESWFKSGLDPKTESEVNQMCNFSQYVKEEGKIETLLDVIQNLVKNTNVDKITAMKSMGIKEEEFPIYLDLLEKQ